MAIDHQQAERLRTSLLRSLLARVRQLYSSDRGSLRNTIEELIEEEKEVNGVVQDHDLLVNALHFSDRIVRDVMVPRAEIQALPTHLSYEEVVRFISERPFSRYPVTRDGLDDVVGLLHIKDVFKDILAPEQFTVHRHLRESLFVSPTMRCFDLLKQMRDERIHMALVVDEYGGVDGLVTVMDIVEEITGDLQDQEKVEEIARFVQYDDGTVLADARARVEEFEDTFGEFTTKEEKKEGISTLGGILMNLEDRIPEVGTLVAHPSGLSFEIIEADSRRIKTLKVHGLIKDTHA